ncbi:VIT1/CCC1 transporter family protein [Lapidilactobacillus bayanensis]|uniref:VIT1/CCC1 transporter family protein n=1 Tax=Lapidilactobacillus bayanensis TaxID=2485998 RepID=UPI001CDC9361|nr:VIT family protein [Lapidilactobacillus bayanensis]
MKGKTVMLHVATNLATHVRIQLKKNFHLSERLNILRAAVLGANDGIISTAGVVVGVAGAHQSQFALMLARISAMFAGAFSMGGGEFVSVSAQRDIQRATKQRQETALNFNYEHEFAILKQSYLDQGLSAELAEKVARELITKDGLNVTLKNKYNLDVHEYFNPWHAALSSFCSFIIGALLPFLMIVFIPYPEKISFTVGAVICALFLTGYTSASMGNAARLKAAIRNVCIGMLTMGITYLIGGLIG